MQNVLWTLLTVLIKSWNLHVALVFSWPIKLQVNQGGGEGKVAKDYNSNYDKFDTI